MRLSLAALALVLVVPLRGAEDDGRRLYLSQCSACHGMDGEGGRGPSLNRPRLVQAPDDEALYRVIRYGIEGTEMPRTWLSPEKIRAVMRQVRGLGRVEQPPLPGDARRGRELYFGGGCDACHTIAGRGGSLGPDLDTIGASRSAAHLRESLQSPQAHITPGFAAVRAETKRGERIVGVVVNASSFSVQLRDTSGRVHSFWRDALTALEPVESRSLMPAVTGESVEDLVAFLAALGTAE